ncbi:MAG: transcription elongation factor GreB [Pseudomonadota bacterium]
MGRWRPPQPKSAPYITVEGYRALETEQDALWLRRRSVVTALSEAAAEGDRSENAEYIYRKKELAGIDRRIRYLQKRLPDLTIVEPRADAERIFFGAWVSLEDEVGEALDLRIVGADEIDAKQGLISVDSPMAKALLGKRLDDEIFLRTDTDAKTYVVVGIRYDGAL